ncbi:MAG: HD domain-containing protein [Desulfobacterales bacterium]|nr:MAG: HD domain-containing protein [Desulfobacterales bacterium]
MRTNDIKLYDLIDFKNPQAILNEIKTIVALIVSDFDYSMLELIYADVESIFSGKYPGYQASNTKYHDLEHTSSVMLAAARLMHGSFLQGNTFSAKNILLGLVAALFHDIGFIQTKSDQNGSGAKYTIGHEQRSVDFMKKYLAKKSFASQDMDNCSHIIMCTILNLELDQIPFQSDEIEMLGKIIGSADLLAQMADRAYLEKLFLLFREFEEAGLPGYGSEFELLQKTEDFYKQVAKKRLTHQFDNIFKFMRFHFKDRWNIDQDLYEKSIATNIKYLRAIVKKCKSSDECFFQHLRRGDIAKKLRD